MTKEDNNRKERKLDCSIDEFCYRDINEGSRWIESHIDLSSKKCENNGFYQGKVNYPTLKLIEDLRKALRRHSEELALIFPNRVKKYSYKKLSILWTDYENFIKNLKRRRSGYKIESEMLDILRRKLTNRFGDKSNKCSKTIQLYYDNEITMNQFFDIVTFEMGRISGEIEVTDEEMGVVLQGTKSYIHDKIHLIRTKYPKCKFSLERLNYMEKNIKLILGENSKKILALIHKYRDLNPDLKLYP